VIIDVKRRSVGIISLDAHQTGARANAEMIVESQEDSCRVEHSVETVLTPDYSIIV
jgi:hypothetical protein